MNYTRKTPFGLNARSDVWLQRTSRDHCAVYFSNDIYQPIGNGT
ncbi:MAG: hypothetical protein ACJ8CB_04305 [Ktedonobacteraceae bacterium]